NPSGTTTLDVWLRTDAARDGSPATCSTGEALTINSYEFILKSTNGQMNWLAFTNLQTGMPTSAELASNATEYHNGFTGGPFLAPGAYKLGSLQVSVALGTPTIGIASASTLSALYQTGFGS